MLDYVDVELFEVGDFDLGIVGAGVIPIGLGKIGREVGGGELVAVAGVNLVAHQAEEALGITAQVACQNDFLIGDGPTTFVDVEVGAEFHPQRNGSKSMSHSPLLVV